MRIEIFWIFVHSTSIHLIFVVVVSFSPFIRVFKFWRVFTFVWSIGIYAAIYKRDKQSVDDVIINLITIMKKCETIFVIFARPPAAF